MATGGTFYSYDHKGSANTITQSESNNATNYPSTGEIDVMPYYKNVVPLNIYNRFSASEKDVINLL